MFVSSAVSLLGLFLLTVVLCCEVVLLLTVLLLFDEVVVGGLLLSVVIELDCLLFFVDVQVDRLDDVVFDFIIRFCLLWLV
jgi:hypothetical protein